MRFTNFEINNFKGIEHVDLSLSEFEKGQIHTLVGLNESGKTTILEAINAFSDSDSTFEQVLYEETHKSSSIQDYVPKNKKSNFTGEITIEATIEFDDTDKEAVRQYMFSKHDFEINLLELGKSFSVKKVFKFEDSNYKGTRNLWNIRIYGKKKRAKNEKLFNNSQDGIWREAVTYIEKMIPSISYFPTFLFDFPQKIYLEETQNEEKQNKYYRTVIQDILDSLGEGLDVQKHIVDRVHEKNDEGVKVYNPFLYFQNRDTKAQIDSVLYKIGDKVTEVIFKTWNEVFERKLKNKSVIVSFGTDDDDSTENQKVYLEFYIKDGSSSYSITERSLGFRWFFCFLLFTQFRGFRKEDKNALFLFDEPASNLHSGAQNQLLTSFPKVTDKGCSIIYSTHSHHLINPKWLENTFIIQNQAIDYDNEEEYVSSQHTNIKAHKYKTFVGENPDKFTYFQPILEKLEYKPSALENIPDAVIFEGKHDYYAFSYFESIIFKDKYNLNYMPGTGANDLDSLISLYKGWGRNFIIMLDADKAGKDSKKYYIDEWLLNENQVFTLSDIDEQWDGATLEKLFSENDRKKIVDENNLGNPKKCKKAIARLVQEKTLSGEIFDFEQGTKNNFQKVIKFCSEKIKQLG